MEAGAGTPVCDACGRRPAVYYRRYSGQRLCARCLARTLERAVRRSIGEAGGLEPRSTVAVAARLSAPHLGAALAEAASRVEGRFGGRVVLLLPDTVEVEGPDLGAVEVVRVGVEPPQEPLGAHECLRFEAAWAAIHARRVGASAVLLPATLTDRILAALDALLAGEPWGVGDYAVLRVPAGGPRVILAPSTVEAEVLAGYAAVRGWRGWGPCRPSGAARRVFYSIARGRPELEYSTGKTLGRLAVEASRAGHRCRWCGGPSPSPGACPACSETRPWERARRT